MPDEGIWTADVKPRSHGFDMTIAPKAVVEAVDALKGAFARVETREQAVIRAISIMYQAIGQKIVLVEASGDEFELENVWR